MLFSLTFSSLSFSFFFPGTIKHIAKEILIKIAAKSQGKILNLYIAFYFKGTGFFFGGGGVNGEETEGLL